MRFRLSGAAQTDLDGIRVYTIENWGRAQWLTYFHDLTQTLERIAEEPGLGRRRETFWPGMRSIPCRAHLIFYVNSTKGGIGIARILHAKQNAAALRWAEVME